MEEGFVASFRFFANGCTVEIGAVDVDFEHEQFHAGTDHETCWYDTRQYLWDTHCALWHLLCALSFGGKRELE